MRYAGAFNILLMLLLTPSVSPAQSATDYREWGLPVQLELFTPQDYGAHPQNWSVVQDRRGVIYVANYHGVLEYDGVRWRLIRTLTGTVVRSLAVDASGTVYVGSMGDIGLLSEDSAGLMEYQSLLHEIAPDERDFADVWTTHVRGSEVLFQTTTRIFRWDGVGMKSWSSENGFHTSFSIAGDFFVRERGIGLLVAADDALVPVVHGELFADLRVFAMVALEPGRILIGTRDADFFVYDGSTISPFSTEADAYLRTHRLYHGSSLPGGYAALATLDAGGLVVIDKDGRLVQILNESNGLPDGWINYVFPDSEAGMWLAFHNKGLARVGAPSDISRFDQRHRLEGLVIDLRRHEGRIFAATSTGLFSLEEGSLVRVDGERYSDPHFEQLPQFLPTYSLLTDAGMLIAGTHDGIYVVQDGTSRQVSPHRVFSLVLSRRHSGRIYAGMKNGIGLLQLDGKWQLSQNLGGIGEEIYALRETDDGTLWVTTRQKNVFRLRFHGESIEPVVERISVPAELTVSDIPLSLHNDEMVFASMGGIFRYKETGVGAEFYRDTLLTPPHHTAGDTLLALTFDDGGNAWMVYSDHVDIARPQHDGSYLHETPPSLHSGAWGGPTRLHIEENGVAWISSRDGLFRYDPRVRLDEPARDPYPALVRRVTTVDSDEMIYGGTWSAHSTAPSSEIRFADNALRFEFAYPSYDDPATNEYQYFLEGRDAGWSAWTKEPSKNYTNLTEGAYRFRVHGRNARGVVSPEGGYAFQILPPWYRTGWAYVLYLFMLFVLATFVARYRRMVIETRRAREQAEALTRERVLNERLQQLNQRLQDANESLRQADRLKDEFIANTSHELRTPLTAILGFTAVLKEEVSAEHVEFLSFIDENGKRLLNTLDALLDLARLRAGTMQISFEKVDVCRQIRAVAASFEDHAQKKSLELSLDVPAEPIYAWLDEKSLDCVFTNLVGNAIKFTDEGSIDVRLEASERSVTLFVRDTGVGIDEKFIPYLFEEFKQESTGLSRMHEGSGLGLAVTARFVQLMGGEIEVYSKKGEGSEFSVTFPRYEATSDGHVVVPAGGDGMQEHVLVE